MCISPLMNRQKKSNGGQGRYERRTSIREKYQRHSCDGEETAHHPDIDQDMHSEVDGDTCGDELSEGILSIQNDEEAPVNQQVEKDEDEDLTH